MNILKISRMTTNAEIQAFCEANPQYSRKIVTAQAKHERRIKRIAYNAEMQALENGKLPWQYRHSIFDRSQ